MTGNFPAPGNYEQPLNPIKSQEPKWGFGTARRKPLNDGETCSPSMQAYFIPSKAIEGRHYNMGKKLQGGSITTRNSHEPGPGAYSPNH